MKKQCLLVLLISTLSLSCSNINIPGVSISLSESSNFEESTGSEENSSFNSVSESEKESISESNTNTSTPIDVSSSSEEDKISISITYDPNGGYGQMDSLLVDSYEFTLSENTFYKPGFNFVGWSLEPNGIIDYADCEEVYITEDTTLYAVYEYSSRKIVELIEDYSKNLPDNISDVVAFYGGQGQYDITKYIPSFIPELASSVELQFGNLVYVGTDAQQYEDMTANFIPISQSYRNISDISLLDAYLELAFAYYYQGTQLQYDQGSSYQRKIRDMKPEDATELYQKYLDCSTYVSNAFYNAFGDIVIQNEDINSITTKVLIDYAKNNKNKSNEVVLYQDNLSSLSTTEKQNALKKFKENLQPGDLYVYRHTNDTAGHVMLYVGNDYFIHSTGASYNYSTLVDKVENYTSVQGEIKPEGSVRYQTASSTVYKESSTRYLFYVDKVGSDSNDRYAILRPLNRSDLKLTPTTIARCMMSGIEIEKSADKYTSVAVGDELTYTISIRNNSDKTIKNVSIKDEIPNNTSFVSMSRTDYFNILGNEMIWNIPYMV